MLIGSLFLYKITLYTFKNRVSILIYSQLAYIEGMEFVISSRDNVSQKGLIRGDSRLKCRAYLIRQITYRILV